MGDETNADAEAGEAAPASGDHPGREDSGTTYLQPDPCWAIVPPGSRTRRPCAGGGRTAARYSWFRPVRRSYGERPSSLEITCEPLRHRGKAAGGQTLPVRQEPQGLAAIVKAFGPPAAQPRLV